MTALAGFWGPAGTPAADTCVQMLAAQALYGPGEPAIWSHGEAALGRRPFLPFDEGDDSPVVGGDGTLALAADLRLDNRDALAAALGLAAAGLTDAQLLMKAIEAWDLDAVARLRGDFAFALWDSRRRRLALARDFLGQRPLHYHRGERGFAFASMAKGLHALAHIPYAPDVARARDFLALRPERGDGSFFAEIKRVEPGHILLVDAAGQRAQRYWSPALAPLTLKSDEDYVEAMRERLDAAVAPRLRGVGDRVGAHLSAGLDSNAAAATAARLMAKRGGTVVAFTSVPRPGYARAAPYGRIGDEGPLAALTAAMHANIEHVPVSSNGQSPAAALDRNFYLFERPVPNLCNTAWWDAINEEAKRRGLAVMLTGQMGNFTLSYSGYELLPGLLTGGRWLRYLRAARALRRQGTPLLSLAQMTMVPLAPRPLVNALARWTGRSVNLPVARHVAGEGRGIRREERAAAARLRGLEGIDLGNFNKGMLGGWGIDYRDPTADQDLVEYCLRVPLDQYLAQGRPRALAVRALADRVPAALLAERRKGYQAADWHEAFDGARDELAGEIDRLNGTAVVGEMIDVGRLRAMIERWPEQDPHHRRTVQSYRGAMLRDLSMGHFLRRASGSNR